MLHCLDAVIACRLALEQNVKPIIAVQALTAASAANVAPLLLAEELTIRALVRP